MFKVIAFVAILGLPSISSSILPTVKSTRDDVKGVDPNNTITDETVRQLLELARDSIEDDMSLPDQHFLNKTAKWDLKADIENFVVKDLNKFIIESTHANMSVPEIGANISLGILNATGKYNVFADTSFFRMFGNGSISANLSGTVISFKIIFGTDKNIVNVDKLVLDYSFNKIQVQFSNFLGGGEPGDAVNDLINGVLIPILNEEKEDIEKVGKHFMNNLFETLGMNMDQLITFINQILGN